MSTLLRSASGPKRECVSQDGHSNTHQRPSHACKFDSVPWNPSNLTQLGHEVS